MHHRDQPTVILALRRPSRNEDELFSQLARRQIQLYPFARQPVVLDEARELDDARGIEARVIAEAARTPEISIVDARELGVDVVELVLAQAARADVERP